MYYSILFCSILLFSNLVLSNASTENKKNKFEYATKIACEWKQLRIECSLGEVITIKNATYGRTDTTTCPTNNGKNTNCAALTSFDVVSRECHNKNHCTVSAHNNIFGDPCVGTEKYLKVEYKCIPAPDCNFEEFRCNDGACIPENKFMNGFKDCRSGEDEIESDYKSEFICEGHTQHIDCDRDEVISIISANYGRLSPKICTHDLMYNQNCKANGSSRLIKEKCNKKGSCQISSTNGMFGDPCVGTYKYTEIYYKCVKAPNCTHKQFQCNHGQCIDLNKKCNGIRDCDGGEDEDNCYYLTEIACENSDLEIHCKTNEFIQIVGANYGRQLSYICRQHNNIHCLSSTSKELVTNSCDGKTSCKIAANNFVFGDPCYGTFKYLAVQYNCINSLENNIPNVV